MTVDDHILLSEVRQDLAKASLALLNAERMEPTVFKLAHDHAVAAVTGLQELLRQETK